MKKIILYILLTVAILFGGFYIYVSDYYRTDTEAVEAFSPATVIEERHLDGGVAYVPEDASAGVIFYPGGKVEYTAYEPLMVALAERGILAVLVKMPFNLAVLKQNAADGIREQFDGIDSWYMAGHSLGGSMAASYISKNTEDFIKEVNKEYKLRNIKFLTTLLDSETDPEWKAIYINKIEVLKQDIC